MSLRRMLRLPLPVAFARNDSVPVLLIDRLLVFGRIWPGFDPDPVAVTRRSCSVLGAQSSPPRPRRKAAGSDGWQRRGGGACVVIRPHPDSQNGRKAPIEVLAYQFVGGSNHCGADGGVSQWPAEACCEAARSKGRASANPPVPDLVVAISIPASVAIRSCGR